MLLRNWQKGVIRHLFVSLYLMQCTSAYPFYNNLDNSLGKKGSDDHDDGEVESFVECGRRRGRRKG